MANLNKQMTDLLVMTCPVMSVKSYVVLLRHVVVGRKVDRCENV